MERVPVLTNLIDVGERMRPVDPKKVEQLADSIREIGLLSPIIVYAPDDETLRLVAGANRLAAIKKLGWEDVTVCIIDGDELHAQLAEIDENLMRNELTATERAEHLQRRKEIWEAMQAQVSGKDYPKPQGGRPEGFASSTSAATGYSKESTNKATRRARDVCQEARDLIHGTKLDTGAFLDRVIAQHLSDTQQVTYVTEALEQKKRDEARKAEKKERDRIANEKKKAAKREWCQFLFEHTTTQEWEQVIDLMECAGWSTQAQALRNWEAPARRAT